MKQEIERKYLVDQQKWSELDKPKGIEIRQGYLVSEASKTIRVRTAGNKAFLTIKGKTVGISRPEYEYELPPEDANELLDLFATATLSKVRYEIEYQGKIWEVDVFSGNNEGLIVAEIELGTADELFEKPDWLGIEVTEDERYYNARLVEMPFTSWPKI